MIAMYRNVSKCSTIITSRWGKGRLMITLKQNRIKEGFFLHLSFVYMYLMMKGSRMEDVIDSSSLEVNILANVSAVVSPAGLFL